MAAVDVAAGVRSKQQSKPDNGPWSSWRDHGGLMTQPLALIRDADKRLQLFGVSPGGQPQYIRQQSSNGPFGRWEVF